MLAAQTIKPQKYIPFHYPVAPQADPVCLFLLMIRLTKSINQVPHRIFNTYGFALKPDKTLLYFNDSIRWNNKTKKRDEHDYRDKFH